MKLCIDCKHYKPSDIANLDRCLHPSFSAPPDLVRGKETYIYCDEQRRPNRNCGPDAAGFEAKEKEEL